MDCDELVELVTDYLEGRLALPERRRFEEHLGICPGCDNYFHQIKLLTSLAATAREPAIERIAAGLLPAFRSFAR